MILAAAGGIDHEDLVKLAEKYFSTLPGGSSLPTIAPCRYTGSEVKIYTLI